MYGSGLLKGRNPTQELRGAKPGSVTRSVWFAFSYVGMCITYTTGGHPLPHTPRISPRRWQAGCEPDLDPRAQAARHCRAQQLASAAQPASVTWLVRVTRAVGGRDSAGQTSQDGAYCTRPRVFLTKFGSLGPIGKTPRKPSWGCLLGLPAGCNIFYREAALHACTVSPYSRCKCAEKSLSATLSRVERQGRSRPPRI